MPAADDPVVARAAVDLLDAVGGAEALEQADRIVAGTGGHAVETRAAEEAVEAVAAGNTEHVVAEAAAQRVVVTATDDSIVTGGADDRVVAGAAVYRVDIAQRRRAEVQRAAVPAADDAVVARTAVDLLDAVGDAEALEQADRIVSGTGDHAVETRTAEEAVEAVAGGVDELVVTGEALQGVVAAPTIEPVRAVAAHEQLVRMAAGDDVDGRGKPLLELQWRQGHAVVELYPFDAAVTGQVPVGDCHAVQRRVTDLDIVALLRNDQVIRRDAGGKAQAVDAARVRYAVVTAADLEPIGIVASAAVERIIADPAGQHVVPVAADQRIAAGEAVDPVDDARTFDAVVELGPIDIKSARDDARVVQDRAVAEVEIVDVARTTQHIGFVEAVEMDLQPGLGPAEHQRTIRQPHTRTRVPLPQDQVVAASRAAAIADVHATGTDAAA